MQSPCPHLSSRKDLQRRDNLSKDMVILNMMGPDKLPVLFFMHSVLFSLIEN